MPPRCSTRAARTVTGGLPAGVEYNIHNHTSARNSSRPYPTSQEWYRRSDTDSPDDSFEDLGNVFAKLVFGFVWLTHLLGLHDLVNTGRCVSRRMLDQLQLTQYQAGLLSRGIQSRMDPREPFNGVLDTAIGFAGAIGVAAFDDMAHVNERVGSLFLLTV
jgi:hypothetical protein